MVFKSRSTLLTVVALFTLALSAGVTLGIASAASAKEEKVSARHEALGKDRGTLVVQADLTMLSDLRGHIIFDEKRALELQEGNVVAISLGHGFAVERFVVQERNEPCHRSSWWRLVSIDRAMSDATLVVRDGFFAGYIRQPELGIEWTLRPISRTTLLPVIAEAHMHECGVVGEGLAGPQEQAGGVAGIGPFCGTCISPYADIAFFYTSLALEAEEIEIANAGGDPDTAPYTLGAKAQLECANTTVAMANSDLPYSVRPVYIGLVEFDEILVGKESYLGAFANSSDGVMDEIHQIRDEFAADNCSLITQNPPAEGAAGIAYVPGSFNVLMRNALGFRLMAHEFGHNVGMHHAYGDDTKGGFECESSSPGDPCRMPCETIKTGEFNYGWRFFGSTTLCWRTVMAYGPGTGILNYSNPDVVYDGAVTGVAIGEAHQANGAELFRMRFPGVTARRCELPEIESEYGRLAAAGGEAFDAFGISVAGDEYRFVGGASLHDSVAIDAGAAYVFAWRDVDEGDPSDPDDDLPARWEQVAKLMPEFLNRGDRFGETMAFDGDVLVIGAPRAGIWETQINEDGEEVEVEIVQGAGYVTVWEWTAEIESFCMTARIQPDGLNDFDWFGTSVSIVDGRIAVGCPRRDTDGELSNNAGAIYTYNYANGIVTPNDVVFGGVDQGQMGSSVAISHDLESNLWLLLGGAPETDQQRGLVSSWTSFAASTSPWFLLQDIQGTEGTESRYGKSLAMDDLVMAVGAPYADDEHGRVVTYAFDVLSNLWIETDVLDLPGDESPARFGYALSISDNRLAVGAPRSDIPFLERVGLVAVYDQQLDGGWNLSDLLRPSGLRAGDELGHAIDLRGNLAFAGAPDADDDGILSGVVYAIEAELEDCNGNMIDDAIDIFLGTEADLNNNGIPDVCENVGCQADFNGDGIVNGLDLGILLETWSIGSCDICEADLNNDGKVNGIDLGLFFAAWGYICDHDEP